MNGNIFLLSRSGKVNFFTSQYCTSRSLKTIMTVLDSIINKYTGKSFNITDYHGDNEFDKAALKDFLQPGLFHAYGRNEHVGPIERPVHTIKERCRSTCNRIPYRRITFLMVRSPVEGVTDMINAFPSKTGISKSLSPSTIAEGKPKLDLSRPMKARLISSHLSTAHQGL